MFTKYTVVSNGHRIVMQISEEEIHMNIRLWSKYPDLDVSKKQIKLLKELLESKN